MLLSIATSLITFASCALAANFTVQVGQGGLNFSPDEVKAAVGDTINFVITSTIHSVTQSTFANPCSHSGFDSGFPSSAGATFSVLVNNTDPIWVYCKQVGHCQAGMVMAINADDSSNSSFDNFKAAATGNPVATLSGSTTGGSTTSVASATTTSGTTSATSYTSGALGEIGKITSFVFTGGIGLLGLAISTFTTL